MKRCKLGFYFARIYSTIYLFKQSLLHAISKIKQVIDKDKNAAKNNKYKGECEPLLIKHTDENFTGVIFRPATVCGYSKRIRTAKNTNLSVFTDVYRVL